MPATVPRRYRCPKCGWRDVRPSGRRGWLDLLLGTFSIGPYRCRTCGARFYRPRRRRADVEEPEA